MVWILELFDTGFEAGDGFTKELCACLALAIVVLAEVLLFRTNALLTGRFRAITALGWGVLVLGGPRTRRGHHFSLPAKDKGIIRGDDIRKERVVQTCSEDMPCLFGEWEECCGMGSPNSRRSL